jgi:hypothetical protein
MGLGICVVIETQNAPFERVLGTEVGYAVMAEHRARGYRRTAPNRLPRPASPASRPTGSGDKPSSAA